MGRGRGAPAAVGVVAGVAAVAAAAGAGGARALRVQQATSEECVFPVEFQGNLAEDCVEWNGDEWCKSASGQWGVCAPRDAGPVGGDTSGLRLSEVNPQSGSKADWVEIVNLGSESASLSGFRLVRADASKEGDGVPPTVAEILLMGETPGDEKKDGLSEYPLGEGACAGEHRLEPGARLVLERAKKEKKKKDDEETEEAEAQAQGSGSPDPCSFDFGLSPKGGRLALIRPDGEAADTAEWQGILPGLSVAQVPEGAGTFIAAEPTLGGPNVAASEAVLREAEVRSAEEQAIKEAEEAEKEAGQDTKKENKGPAPGSDVGGECCRKLEAIGFRSELPVVIIDAARKVPDEPKVPVQLCTCGAEGSPEKDYKGQAGAETRGNSSQRQHKKKSMLIELKDETGEDREFKLLGLPKEEDFVLYGPESDKTQGLRNYLAFNFARRMDRYASEAEFVEVFLNQGSSPLSMRDYHGVYLLGEKIKRGKKRVDICKHDREKDLEGGYILKHDNDNIDKGDLIFTIGSNSRRSKFPLLKMVMVYPKGNQDEMEPELTFAKQWLDAFEAALVSDEWTDPEVGWRRFADEDSFIDYFLGVEMTKNPDAYRGSTYMHKDCGGLLAMGPMWDYNEAFGVCCGYPIEGYRDGGRSSGSSGGSAISPEGWRFNICKSGRRCKEDPLDGISRWYLRLWDDPIFQRNLRNRWAELRAPGGNLEQVEVDKLITDARDLIRPAAGRNYQRWGSQADLGDSRRWQREVDDLQTWLQERLSWLDQALTPTVAYEFD